MAAGEYRDEGRAIAWGSGRGGPNSQELGLAGSKALARAGEGTGAWFVVHTGPGEEQKAYESLARADFEVWYPRSKVRRRLNRGRSTVVRWKVVPYFPRYMFALVPPERGFYDVTQCVGVSGLISFNGRPSPIPGRIMKRIRFAFDADSMEITGSRFKVGDLVKIESGLFAGNMAAVTHDDGKRVGVLLQMLGASRTITLDIDAIAVD